jgi:diadenosine tetraphosphatase ApaH/serine/threonine PP2A family protein phosphatase
VRRAGVGRIVVGGDVVPGPMPSECLALLRDLDLPTHCVRGNGERVVLAQRRGEAIDEVPESFREGIRWNASQLSDEDAEWMAAWPLTARLAVPAIGDIVFCHATPRNDTEIFTRNTAESRLLPIVTAVNAAVIVCGHTHMQFDRNVGSTRIVNAGSVGMSFQGTGAFWAEIDQDVRLRRTTYDLEAAATRVRNQAGYAQAEEFAAQYVLNTPGEEAMLAAFAASEL